MCTTHSQQKTHATHTRLLLIDHMQESLALRNLCTVDEAGWNNMKPVHKQSSSPLPSADASSHPTAPEELMSSSKDLVRESDTKPAVRVQQPKQTWMILE
jgi:hypothetical protein